MKNNFVPWIVLRYFYYANTNALLIVVVVKTKASTLKCFVV